MPTILLVNGWRFFFYSNEGSEPIHIHCQKGDREAKFWLDSEEFEVTEAYGYQLSPRDRRQIKKIIFEYFEYIENEWEKFQKMRNPG
ncbi:MAG: DUF4160 domain-containing protein [Candidatus Marinimicrobia bacterium]|nr:DUF4160 domain-containing protein [Candidatus Neomarinimicrobiota bacterium]